MMPVIQLLRDLIALPSVNPAFGRPDPARTGEGRVAALLAQMARQAGLEVEFQPVFPERPNLVVRVRPAGRPRSRVLLAPHLDTVDGAPSQFRPRRRGDRVYGRGAADTKGSVAAMFTSVLNLTKAARRPASTEVLFVGLVDEEDGQSGSRALARTRLRADLAIVGEPTCLQVVTAHKGDLWLRLETRGKAAHGARPELGRNAVHEMARVVDLLQTSYAAELRRKRHPLLGVATVSVGSIAGGTQPNIVPDQCVISADRRTLPGETEASVRRGITSRLRRQGLRVRIRDSRAAPCWPLETDPALPLVRQLMDVVGQARPAGVDYFCDASVLARGSIPSVVFGPGDIAQAHTANEWISVRSLERATALLTRFLTSLP